MSDKKLEEFEKKIGYRFKNIDNLKLALTHSSYGHDVYHDKHINNERLEFLGDAVLELIVSEEYYFKYKDVAEGILTKNRARTVCESTLAICARDIDLPKYLFVGKGEEVTGGRFRDSITSDAMEAVLGAIYLDGGIECARKFVDNFILNDIENKIQFTDSKSIFQERIQAMGYTEPKYLIVGESGPDNNREFVAEVYVNEQKVGEGKGSSKKAAQQAAAYDAMTKMKVK